MHGGSGNLVSFFLSSQAATDESTPPLIATKTFLPILLFDAPLRRRLIDDSRRK